MTLPIRIVHFAPIALDTQSGMGRVAYHWKEAIVRRGWDFEHFGVHEVPAPRFKPLWALSARGAWRDSGTRSSLMLAHEPSAEVLRQTGVPVVLFSHGLEARCREMSLPELTIAGNRWKNLVMRPFWAWRSKQTEHGLRNCPLLLLINQEDRTYAMERYGRRPDDIFVFRNGVDPSPLQPEDLTDGPPTILFYGSWLERKGKSVLVQAASRLAARGFKLRWLLVGTGKPESAVLADWPEHLRYSVVVKPHVAASDDDAIYQQATVFVLPSYFEGQPLTLLQAMESGRCVITTRCCGQKDIIRNGENGFLFEPGDDEALAALVATALDDANLRRSVGAKAKADMQNRRWESVSDEVAERLAQFALDSGVHG
jgi:glycosyltransferase involved in cell wall biosynthesis